MAVVIADLLPEPVRVNIGKGEITLRGIPLSNIVGLLINHKDEVATFFVDNNFNAHNILATAPEMAIEIMAIGMDAVGQEDDIAQIPAGAQIEILLGLWALSVPDVKKLRDALLGVMASISLDPKSAIADLSTNTSESTLPKPSSSSSVEAIPLKKSGDTPTVN